MFYSWGRMGLLCAAQTLLPIVLRTLSPHKGKWCYTHLFVISDKTKAGQRKGLFFFFPFLFSCSLRSQSQAAGTAGLLALCPARSRQTHLSMGLKFLFPFPHRTGSLIISSFEFKWSLILVGDNITWNSTAGAPVCTDSSGDRWRGDYPRYLLSEVQTSIKTGQRSSNLRRTFSQVIIIVTEVDCKGRS